MVATKKEDVKPDYGNVLRRIEENAEVMSKSAINLRYRLNILCGKYRKVYSSTQKAEGQVINLMKDGWEQVTVDNCKLTADGRLLLILRKARVPFCLRTPVWELPEDEDSSGAQYFLCFGKLYTEWQFYISVEWNSRKPDSTINIDNIPLDMIESVIKVLPEFLAQYANFAEEKRKKLENAEKTTTDFSKKLINDLERT